VWRSEFRRLTHLLDAVELPRHTITHSLISPQAAAAKESAKNAAFEKAEARRRVR
jgi:hypothetical protein